MREVAIVGAGTVGKALGRRLALAGWAVRAVSCRTMEHAREAAAFVGQAEAFDDAAKCARRGEVVLLTVPDDRIREVAESLDRQDAVRKGAFLVHTSGGRPAIEMSAVRRAHLASMHPLQSFASSEAGAEALTGASFACEGDGEAIPIVREMVAALGGRYLAVDGERKALYHAGAVVACNYLATLVDCAAELFAGAGIPREDAVAALLPLLRGTVENLGRVGLPRALTGPIARGDAETVEAHLRAIARERPELLSLYSLLGILTIPVAEEKGTLSEEAAARMSRLFYQPQTGGPRKRRRKMS